jgi:transcription elongation factor Elf1
MHGLRYTLKSKYGITPQDRFIMLLEQRFQCPACKTRFDGTGKAKVDHCHKTGAVRGLLCNSCNLSLGLMNENADSLRALADYIEKFQKK